MSNNKSCNECKLVKSFKEFSKNKNSKDGFQHNCKQCVSFYDKQYRNKLKETRNYTLITNKQCSKCLIIKTIKDFPKNLSKKLGISSECKSCDALVKKEYQKNNKKEISLKRKERYIKNPEPSKKRAAKNRKLNPDYNEKWKQENPEKVKKHGQNYVKAHPDKLTANSAKIRAAKLQRTPKWLTQEDLKEIEQFYTDAKECQWLSEEPLEVDHIIPLLGKNVSGLHVPSNLQILPKPLNASKGNRFK